MLGQKPDVPHQLLKDIPHYIPKLVLDQYLEALPGVLRSLLKATKTPLPNWKEQP